MSALSLLSCSAPALGSAAQGSRSAAPAPAPAPAPEPGLSLPLWLQGYRATGSTPYPAGFPFPLSLDGILDRLALAMAEPDPALREPVILDCGFAGAYLLLDGSLLCETVEQAQALTETGSLCHTIFRRWIERIANGDPC